MDLAEHIEAVIGAALALVAALGGLLAHLRGKRKKAEVPRDRRDTLPPGTMLCLALALSLSACSAIPWIVKVLPKVVATLVDAGVVLDQIESFVDSHFAQFPSDSAEPKVKAAIDKARVALSVALRTARGGDSVTQGEIDAAFADFREAYRELLVLVQPMGVKPVPIGEPMGVAPGTLAVPTPEDLAAL